MVKKKGFWSLKSHSTRLYILSIINKKKKIVKKKIKYNHKYKKPTWLRKSHKKFKSLLWLNNIDTQSLFQIKDKFQFKKGFFFKSMPIWRKLYLGYLQFFFGVSKKPLISFFNNLSYKSRGFWEVFTLLKHRLSFFFIYNIFKKKQRKPIILKFLNNGIIRNFRLKTRLKIISLSHLLKLPTKSLYFNKTLNFSKNILKQIYMQRYKLRLWQKTKFLFVRKSITFFHILSLKKKYSKSLFKNRYFFNHYIKFCINNFKIKNQNFSIFKVIESNFLKKLKIKIGLKSFILRKIIFKKFFKKDKVLPFFKKISKKDFWLKSFWLKTNFKKKKYKISKKYFIFYFLFFQKKKLGVNKLKKKFLQKFLKRSTLDFNIIKQNIFKKKLPVNFIHKRLFFLKKNNLLCIKNKKKKFLSFKFFNKIRNYSKFRHFFKPKKMSKFNRFALKKKKNLRNQKKTFKLKKLNI